MPGTNLRRDTLAETVPEVPNLHRYRLRRTEGELTSYVGMIIFLGSWAMMFAALGVLAIHARPPRGTTRSAVRLWGMFWHFVGAVWLALYVAVYLV